MAQDGANRVTGAEQSRAKFAGVDENNRHALALDPWPEGSHLSWEIKARRNQAVKLGSGAPLWLSSN